MSDSTSNQQEYLNQAIQFHGSGDLKSAEAMYRKVLAVAPKQPVALHYLGVVALQMGQIQPAIELINQALRVTPQDIDALSNLGNAYQAAGDYEKAITQYQKALAIKPDIAMIVANLGNARSQLGLYEAAEKDYSHALKLQPDLFEVHRNLALVKLSLNKPSEALESCNRAEKINPNSAEIKLTKGNILQELLRYKEAVDCYQQVLKQQPKVAQVHNNLANVYREMGKLDESLSHYQSAIHLKPDYAEAHFNLASARQDQGDKKSAIASARKAVSLDTNYAKAHHLLANLVKHDQVDNDIKSMESLVDNSLTNNEDKMYLSFGLGKAYYDLGDYSQSFDFYQRANKLQRRSFEYDINEDAELINNIKTAFNKSFLQQNKANGISQKRPIFILGMPRSGTSLVEQILASHSKVHGGGELQFFPLSLIKEFGMHNGTDPTQKLDKINSESFKLAGQKYLSSLSELVPDTKIITDKLPMNFLYLGLIKLVFPDSLIIHCQRNPIETCFSIYKNFFAKSGHYYAYDLAELGTYYNLYRDLMNHWREVLPGSFYDISYEALINNQAEETKKLLNYCNLEWENSCLEFYNTDRQVSTLSANQVRKPIYTDSIKLSEQYASFIQPLSDVLNSY